MNKRGRPTDLDNLDKKRISVTFDKRVLKAIKIALLTSHEDKHKTISGLVNEAVIQYLEIDAK